MPDPPGVPDGRVSEAVDLAVARTFWAETIERAALARLREICTDAVRRRVGRPAISTIVFETMFAKVRDGGMAPTPDLAHAYTFTGPLDDFDPQDFDASADAADDWRTEMHRAVTDAVRAAGYDPDDDAVFYEIDKWMEIAEVELAGAQTYSLNRELHEHGHTTAKEWAPYRDDELYAGAYREVYAPPAPPPARLRPNCGVRPRSRPPRARRRRRHGSRRAAGVRSGQDPGDGDSEPVVARPRRCWQTAGAS